MSRLLFLSVALTASTLAAGCAPTREAQSAATAAPAASERLDAAIAGAHRSPENRARDAYRHPRETLGFFGIRPDMTVVEIAPGAGWYTEILAPYLKDQGMLYAAHNNPAISPGAARGLERYKAKLASDPVYANVKVTMFFKDAYDIAPAGTADAVLTFRNVHNFHINGFGAEAFKAFYTALKPGGVLGVVEHRLPENRPDSAMMTSGYMKRSTVVALAEAAGFKLAAESEINANPKDTADYPKGVWTLPPNYAEGDVDRARYAAIGESDRMTLKFVKPR